MVKKTEVSRSVPLSPNLIKVVEDKFFLEWLKANGAELNKLIDVVQRETCQPVGDGSQFNEKDVNGMLLGILKFQTTIQKINKL